MPCWSFGGFNNDVKKVSVIKELLGYTGPEIIVLPVEMDDILHAEDHRGDYLFDKELYLGITKIEILVIIPREQALFRLPAFLTRRPDR